MSRRINTTKDDDFPFDETPKKSLSRPARTDARQQPSVQRPHPCFKTASVMRAVSLLPPNIESKKEEQKYDSLVLKQSTWDSCFDNSIDLDACFKMASSTRVASMHHGDNGSATSTMFEPTHLNKGEMSVDTESERDVNGRDSRQTSRFSSTAVHSDFSLDNDVPVQLPRIFAIQRIGPPRLGVFKAKLPLHMHSILDKVAVSCEHYAKKQPTGWKTELYSLTKQDLALSHVHGGLKLAEPIIRFVHDAINSLYPSRQVRMDCNQPHVLKYSKEHRGVELHHDRCDVTANLMMSARSDYGGGGTCIPSLKDSCPSLTIVLEKGEFLLHPGSLVHGGRDLTWGTRYLMVFFCHLEAEE